MVKCHSFSHIFSQPSDRFKTFFTKDILHVSLAYVSSDVHVEFVIFNNNFSFHRYVIKMATLSREQYFSHLLNIFFWHHVVIGWPGAFSSMFSWLLCALLIVILWSRDCCDCDGWTWFLPEILVCLCTCCLCWVFCLLFCWLFRACWLFLVCWLLWTCAILGWFCCLGGCWGGPSI